MKTLLCTLALSVCALASLGAQTVELVLFGNWADDSVAQARSTECLLSGALDALFDRGFIATNALPRRAPEPAFASYAPGLDAIEGAIDFIVAVFADYGEGRLVPDCRYRVLRVGSGSELASGSLAGPTVEPADRKALDKACASMGAAVVAESELAIRGARGVAEGKPNEEA